MLTEFDEPDSPITTMRLFLIFSRIGSGLRVGMGVVPVAGGVAILTG